MHLSALQAIVETAWLHIWHDCWYDGTMVDGTMERWSDVTLHGGSWAAGQLSVPGVCRGLWSVS